jgi:hypothetical protein
MVWMRENEQIEKKSLIPTPLLPWEKGPGVEGNWILIPFYDWKAYKIIKTALSHFF